MMRLLLLLLVLTLPIQADDLTGKPDPKAPRGWKRYVLGAHPSVSVCMPARPTVRDLPKQHGIDRMTLWKSGAGLTLALVQTADHPMRTDDKGFRTAYVNAALQSIEKAFTLRSKIPLVQKSEAPVKAGGWEGTERVYAGKVKGRLRVLTGGKQSIVISLFAIGPGPDLSRPFMDSVRLLP